ncbi:hypothetical protein [Mucilaginibacter glaciei]|uniref:Uncharacterized protein n=1 Tax=Mucilaginibacter glaciei TaxID=2772109 RepID=A0A926S2K9_9SPHI|nr:hypothetical protein [Mucilaginibacter glaciei]MBD1395230.1 hypothetical protein [Mucilaginibacter glaciei]
MKKILITAAIFVSLLTVKQANAQISFSLNIGSQPAWGPVGYDHADYYYMPDIDTYYDVPAHQYVYLENNNWVRRASLPPRYSNYNLYNGYKVVVNERSPWLRNNVYRTKYAGYKGRTGQTVIRDSRDVKYRNHWTGNGNGNDRREIRNDRREVRDDKREVRQDRKDLRDDRKDNRQDRKDDKRGHGRP